MNTLNKNSSNKEISEVLKNEIATGNPVIFNIKDTKNADYKSVYLIQDIKNVPSRGTSSEEGFEVSNMMDEILGIESSNKSLYRTIHSFKTEQLKALKKTTKRESLIGMDFNKLEIEVSEDTNQNYDTENQSLGTINKVKETPLTLGGEPIYKHTTLKIKGEAKHNIIKDVDQLKENFVAEATEVFNQAELDLSGPSIF